MKNFIKILGQIWRWLLGGVMVLGVGYYFIANQTPPGANLTIYPVQCDNSASALNNCTNPQKLDRIAYKVAANSNKVVYWDPDITGNINYSNGVGCSIADENNWSCASGDYGVNDGKYFDTRNSNVIFVSAVDWTSMQRYTVSAYGQPSSPLISSEDVTNRVFITCLQGSGQVISGTQTDINFSQSDFDASGTFINHAKNRAIQVACGITPAEAMADLKKFMNGDKSAILFSVSLADSGTSASKGDPFSPQNFYGQ